MSEDKFSRETVVLVHGLWMHGWVMTFLKLQLNHCGFHTVIFSYPSMRNSLSKNAHILSNFVAEIASSHIHFVGHSLGGLLIMQMLSECPDPRTGRIVLAGSPCKTNYIASKISRSKIGKYLIGHSMLQYLNQDVPESTYSREIGSIAGSRSLGAGKLLGGLPEPNDGVVAVEETKIPSLHDQVVLNVSHSGMLFSSNVAKQVCMFLQNGKFSHNQRF